MVHIRSACNYRFFYEVLKIIYFRLIFDFFHDFIFILSLWHTSFLSSFSFSISCTVLCSTVLYCTLLLYCSVQYCTLLYFTVLYFIILIHTVFFKYVQSLSSSYIIPLTFYLKVHSPHFFRDKY